MFGDMLYLCRNKKLDAKLVEAMAPSDVGFGNVFLVVASNEKEIMDHELIADKMSSASKNSHLSATADALIDTLYNSMKEFEKEAVTAGREYSQHRMNQCIGVTIYGISFMNDIKMAVLFAAFTYVTLMLSQISKKFPKKA